MDEFEKEVKLDFLTEAIQLLESAERAFLALENDKNNLDLINEIFRLAHNLKGTSRAVGFGDVAEFTHEMENLILKIKDGKIEINNEIVTLLLACNDHVSTMIRTLNMDLYARFSSVDIIEKIKLALDRKIDSSASLEIKDKIEDNSNMSESLSAEDMALLDNFEQNLEASSDSIYQDKSDSKPLSFFIANTPVESELIQDGPAVPSGQKKTASNKTSSEEDSIRVALPRIELLNNVVGELVIIQTVLNQHREEFHNPLMLKSLTQLAKLSKEIQNISMSLRMVQLKQTLQKMQRIVRDTSKTLNKKVSLEIFGEETEVDKTVLEYLADPLVHIIRNAIDHGLESTSERLLIGKSDEGKVAIKAYHEGNSLVIEISDDGKGINPKTIREKAIEKNIISANTAISDEELVNLIFHPGFSTKSEVTEISGRGVGMDVVKTNIEKLSGEVKVITVLGKGSVFKVVLPLTMAIIEAMVTKIGTERYIIPLRQIYESLSPTPDLVFHVNGMGDCLKIRGQVIPLLKISTALQRSVKEKPIHEQIAIIVHSPDRKFAVLVDDILHQQQVVIKKLGVEIKNQTGFMGSSILGDGQPAFILDLVELFRSTIKNKKSSFIEEISA